MNNVKVYKNKLRNVKEKYQVPVPQYQELGVTPTEYKSSIVAPNTPVIKPQELSVRNRSSSFISDNTSQVVLPKIKPSQESWAAINGEVIDDNFNQSGKMIDNNNFYTEEALGFSSEDEDGNSELNSNLLSVINDLNEDTYLLLVHGDTICSGPIEEIESETRALIFGEHALCQGEPISEESIIVLKKVKIKVGVFLQ